MTKIHLGCTLQCFLLLRFKYSSAPSILFTDGRFDLNNFSITITFVCGLDLISLCTLLSYVGLRWLQNI